MSAPLRCVACQMVESEALAASSSISFLSLAPCQHTMCSDCYSNPCTLVQCYGCPACGTIPTSTSTLLQASSSSAPSNTSPVVEEAKEQKEESYTFDCTTTLDSLYYNPTGFSSTYSSYYYQPADTVSYSYSSAYQGEEQGKMEQEQKQEEKMVEMTSSEIHEYVSTHGLTDLSCSSSDIEEDLKEEEIVAEKEMGVVSSEEEASSAPKKRRRQKKAGKGPVSRWEGTNAKPSKAPTVIVPKECPDHLRPKRKPAPTTCREHGRRLVREEVLGKIRRGKNADMRKMKEICRDMSCCY